MGECQGCRGAPCPQPFFACAIPLPKNHPFGNKLFTNLTIQSDFIFKKVMSRKRICKHLLEELLQIEIADINYLEAEKTLEPEYTSRGIRLDIIVADDKNTHYNLEMQVKNNKNPDTDTYVLPKRSRYYQALLDIDLLQKGQPYDLLPPTFIIFICVFDFFEKGNYVYTFKKTPYVLLK